MAARFCNFSKPSNLSAEFEHDLDELKKTFAVLQIFFCIIGITGNVLNLRTLQSPNLQTVPFMYIRALAMFDLMSLSFILLHFAIYKQKNSYYLALYLAHVDTVLINTFLVTGLYCAFMLTIERYFLISRPYFKPTCDPHMLARRKIFCMFLCSLLLHTPIALQSTVKLDESGYSIANNSAFLCRQPLLAIFTYYKMTREFLRFFVVFIMTLLNIFMARKLQLAKHRRRRLTRKQQVIANAHVVGEDQCLNRPPYNSKTFAIKKEHGSLARSFAEKKLTALMIAICLIYIVGNVPQIVVMLIQNEAMDKFFGFQLYRNISNLMEVVNHCLNFYVFCMASREYMRTFLVHCFCVHCCISKSQRLSDFMVARRTSRFTSTSAYTDGVSTTTTSAPARVACSTTKRSSTVTDINTTTAQTDSSPTRGVRFDDDENSDVRDSDSDLDTFPFEMTNGGGVGGGLQGILRRASQSGAPRRCSLAIANEIAFAMDEYGETEFL